jgi:hypothetical protein
MYNCFLVIIIRKNFGSGVKRSCVHFLALPIISCMTIEIITRSTLQNSYINKEIKSKGRFIEFLARVNSGHSSHCFASKYVAVGEEIYCLSHMSYLIKPSCLHVRHDVLLPLGIPEISAFLQTSRLKNE